VFITAFLAFRSFVRCGRKIKILSQRTYRKSSLIFQFGELNFIAILISIRITYKYCIFGFVISGTKTKRGNTGVKDEEQDFYIGTAIDCDGFLWL